MRIFATVVKKVDWSGTPGANWQTQLWLSSFGQHGLDASIMVNLAAGAELEDAEVGDVVSLDLTAPASRLS